MDWFVISPVNGLTSWPDDANGQKEVAKFIENEMDYYNGGEDPHGLKPDQYLIFRGEQHQFIPPTKTPIIVKTRSGG